MAVGKPINFIKIAAKRLFSLPSEAQAIKMAMAVGQPIIIMKNSCKAAIFIAKRSVGNKNGYGRRSANK